MLSGVAAKGEAIGKAAQAQAIDRLAEQAREVLPDVDVSTAEDGIVLAGRGLMRRLADNAVLRWIGSLWR